MRILVGSIGHESNTFTPLPTTLDDFRRTTGAATLSASGRQGAFSGIVRVLRAGGAELVPSICAGAMPGGLVQRSAFEALQHALLEPAHNVDGVCLFLHGAMRAEGVDYGDSQLLAALRAQLGPNVPITVAMDMHANIVGEMIHNVDAIVAYHTAPHVDRVETGEKAARILLQILQDGAKPEMAFAKIPFLLPGEMAQTHLEPTATMMRTVDEIEAMPGVLSASMIKTHCWADVPDMGVIGLVVTDGDAALAQRESTRLASMFWERRAEFSVSAETYPVPEAVDTILAATESTVFLSDAGDNPGAGGTTDVPVLLAELLAKGATNVLVASIWDAGAVQACMAAGIGATVSLTVGGKLDTANGSPLPVTGRVRLLVDGHRYRGGVRATPDGGGRGPIAVLNVSGIDVILSTTRLSFVDPAQMRALGLEPLDYRTVVLKRGYLTAPFQAISPRAILALSPGATHCDVRQMSWRRVNRPIYPLDPDAAWSPR